MSATIRLNGETRSLSAATIEALLIDEGLDPKARGLAVALNGAVAPKVAWATTAVAPGDEIEVVKAVRGG